MNVLITGGCGFIGCNVAAHHIRLKHRVTVLDNLARIGSVKNLEWLKGLGKIVLAKHDICDAGYLKHLLKKEKYDIIYHFAAQVAVTTSVTDPRKDFEINALGSLNLLESMRLNRSRAILIYASTNKVYGEMQNVKILESRMHVRLADYPHGINEDFSLDFHSPYGCSKGSSDQYMRDYHRIYGLSTVVFRQSCIYGERQFGVEDQGWVAHFIIQNILNRPIRIYGDGRQVRDVLHISDLISSYDCAWKNRSRSSGKIYNMGGGNQNQLSLLNLISILEKRSGRKMKYSSYPNRPGDQRIYVSDTSMIERDLGWRVKIGYRSGIEKLISWVEQNRNIFR